MNVRVIAAYTTNHFPLGGNLPEEVLELETGEGVYLNPGLEDEVYPDLDEALARCTGTPEDDDDLLAAWDDGYDIPQYGDGTTP